MQQDHSQQQGKDKVKEELMKLQKHLGKSNFKLLHTQSFPYIFQILFSEDTFQSIASLHVDFNGLWIEFSFDEAYPFHHPIQPSRSLFVTQVLPYNNQILPRKLLRLFKEGLNFSIEKLHKNGQTAVWEVLQWFERSGFKQIIMKPEFVQSYVSDGAFGESSRRFLVFNSIEKDDPSSEPEEEEESDGEEGHEHTDDEEEEEIQLDSLINPPPTISLTNCDHGVILELEDVDFSNVAVLECNVLNIQVQCSRCQHRIDVPNLHTWKEKRLSCQACSKEMSVTYYASAVSGVQQSQQQIEAQGESHIFAQVEMNGCNFWDVMKSNFQSICFECSHVVPMEGLKLRSMNEFTCEKCHSTLGVRFRNIRKYTFAEALEALSSLTDTSNSSTKKRVVTAKTSKPKSKTVQTGLKPGEPLPKEGTCKHYKHSHRWLLFPCCGKAYPCDDCHDEAETHKAVFAMQQICGFCSRQQNISSGKCLYCGKALTKKVSSSHGKPSSSVAKTKSKTAKTSKK